MWARIEQETNNAVDILTEEQYKAYMVRETPRNDLFLNLPDELKDVSRGIRQYKLNDSEDGLVFCDELAKDFKLMSIDAVTNSYRLERDMLLKSTDWTQIIDVISDDGWKEYRKYLRDFPKTFTPDLNDKGEQKIPFILPTNLDEYRKMIAE